jgi:hypothetical protein
MNRLRDIPLIVAVIILLALGVRAQDTRPRLELEPQLNLNGAGFQLVSGSMTAGAGMEENHFNWHVFGTYDAAKKDDWDSLNANLNPHGNVRSVGGSLWGRTSGGWLFGASGSYAQDRTTLYTKDSWGIGVGAGHDWMHATCPTCNPGEFATVRLTVEYALPTQKGNDVEHGFLANFWVPSPIETQRHFFFHVTGGAGWVCDPSCGAYGSSSFGILFRF